MFRPGGAIGGHVIVVLSLGVGTMVNQLFVGFGFVVRVNLQWGEGLGVFCVWCVRFIKYGTIGYRARVYGVIHILIYIGIGGDAFVNIIVVFVTGNFFGARGVAYATWDFTI